MRKNFLQLFQDHTDLCWRPKQCTGCFKG
ncbi:similar to natural killer cell protease 7 (predicted) [Rattus norvegicus]|uniref:Similar to natural killer cell protease 7 (Predicted) n=1 Tax=Rattus norvegicus TaxID=10116 RepID=A6KH85_RAT|nr:similar to natural killer cell protease 7 (predicted) [Rattus norvegicus]